MKWNKRETTLLLVCLILLMVVVVKSLFYDGYIPKTPEEKQAVERVQETLKNSSFIRKKVVQLKKISEEKKLEAKVELGYMLTLRNYLLWIIPVGESRVLV